jgi:hypothetical protein
MVRRGKIKPNAVVFDWQKVKKLANYLPIFLAVVASY